MKLTYKKYDKYKDSGIEWIGEIPEHWKTALLRWLSVRYSGGTPNKSNLSYWENGVIPWLNSGTVNQVNITEPSAYITTEAFENSSAKWIFKGNLVMALAGQGKTKGMVAQLKIDTTCNQSMAAICPNKVVNNRYLFWWLIRNYIRIRHLAGGNLRDGLNLEMIASIPCPIPEHLEQQAIADYLDKKTVLIDELISKKRRQIELLTEQRQAVINQAVTKGLDPNVEMKDSGIEWLGEIPKHWEVRRLRYVFGMKTGLSITKEELQKSGIPIVNYGDIHTKYGFDLDLSRDDLKFADERYIASKKSALTAENDFVFCDTSEDIEGSGNCVYISNLNGSQIIAGSHTIIAKPIIEVNSRYLAYLFMSPSWRSQIRSEVYGVKVYSITQKLLKDTFAILPLPNEQQQIVVHLDLKTAKIDKSIFDSEHQIELLQEYRTALISEAVTGKIDVREAV